MSPEQIAETWRQSAARLLLIARAIGEPAEDAVQEAFLQLARQSKAPDDPFAWLVTVTRNQLLQWQRSGDRRRRREHATSKTPWFEDHCGQSDLAMDSQQVTAALTRLDSQQREVIVMHLWGELSFDKIAAVLGCSRSGAHRTFQAGIHAIRQHFDATVPSTTHGVITDERT